MRTTHNAVSTTIALCGTLIAPAAGALDPATFDEYVGIGLWGASGTNAALAEFVTLTVQSPDFDHRGGGTGFARAGAIMPVTAEAELHLTGDTNQSGIGGTATVQTSFQFRVVTNAGGLPATVPLIFHGSASVWVDSNLPVGNNFARITWPASPGGFQADNYDASGAYTGNFTEQRDIPFPNWPVASTGTITLHVYTHGQGYGPAYFFDVRSWISTEIEIDPAFALADQYAIELSPGVSPALAPPGLAIALTATNTVLVSWPSPSTGWTLEQNTSLTTTNWVTPPESITDDGTNKFILVNPPSGNCFYRLYKP